jgi:hypothetical protein
MDRRNVLYMNTETKIRTATADDAWTGLPIGAVLPNFQMGSRQWATWAKLTDAQRIQANELMRTMTAGKALAAVKAGRA